MCEKIALSIDQKTFIEYVIEALTEIDSRDQELSGPLADLSGLSGCKTVKSLQRLTNLIQARDITRYLEIGVFQGLSFSGGLRREPRCHVLRCGQL